VATAYIATAIPTKSARAAQIQPNLNQSPEIPAQIPPTSRRRRPTYEPVRLKLERSVRAAIRLGSF